MRSLLPLLAATYLIAGAGCKSAQPIAGPLEGVRPALLIGPEATSRAASPSDLPVKEAARLCLRTAQEFEKNGQTDDAIRLYEKARTDAPAATGKVAGRRLAVLYDKVGNFTKSAAEYEILLKAHPKDADLLNDLGYSHYCRGDWPSAEACLTRAVQADPTHKRAWTNLGLAQAQQAKWDDSFQSFTKAVRPADAHCNVAFVMATQGSTTEAKARYQRALTLDPGLRMAQVALVKLDNPQGLTQTSGIVPLKTTKYDAVEAAAKIPTFAELEARIKRESNPTAATDITDLRTPGVQGEPRP